MLKNIRDFLGILGAIIVVCCISFVFIIVCILGYAFFGVAFIFERLINLGLWLMHKRPLNQTDG